MKYIIDLERINGTNLYRAKGFNTLVFDEYGLSLLESLKSNEEKTELKEGCTIRTQNGTTLYEFKGYTNDGYINAINKSNGRYVSLSGDKYIVVQEEE